MEVIMIYDFIDEKKYDNHANNIQEICTQFLDCDSLTQSNFILILIVLLNYASCEELTRFGLSYRLVYKYLQKLTKSGLIQKIPIELSANHRVSFTDDLFTFTKNGYDMVNDVLCGNKVLNAYPHKKSFENIHNLHSYLVGMNLVEALIGLNNKHFNWIREEHLHGKKSFVCDCRIASNKFNIYFEEDLGNEKNEILLNKLLQYQKYPPIPSEIYQPSDCNPIPILSSKNTTTAIVFSYYQPRTHNNAVGQGKINELVDSLDMQADSTSVVNISPELLAPKNKNTLEMIKDEFINPKKNKLLQQRCKGVIPEYTWKNANNEKLNALKVFDLRDMRKKYSGENPFLQNSFRKKQYISFSAKRENLFETFTKMSYYTDYHDIYNEIYCGYPIYIVPTCLLSRYIRYIAEFKSYFPNLSRCLEPYFGKIDYASFKSNGRVIDTKEVKAYLRNIISTPCCNVCIEFPTIDFPSKWRIKTFYEHIQHAVRPTQLIVLVDYIQEAFNISYDIKDFEQFSKLRKTEKDTYCYDSAMQVSNIFYLKRSDLEAGRPNSLFFVSGLVIEGYDKNGNPKFLEENHYCKLIPGRLSTKDEPKTSSLPF